MQNARNRRSRPSRDRRQIDRWEKIRTVVDERSDRGNLPLKFNISIERPIFTNGDVGYLRVNAIITVGSYYVRLATRALIDLLDILAEHRGKILDAVDEVRDRNDERDREKSENRKSNGNHTKPKDRIPVKKEDYPLLDDETLNQGHGRHRRARGRSFHPGGKRQ